MYMETCQSVMVLFVEQYSTVLLFKQIIIDKAIIFIRIKKMFQLSNNKVFVIQISLEIGTICWRLLPGCVINHFVQVLVHK